VKALGLNEIRKAFLDFYADHGHYVTSSYSLIPHDDKSLLLVNAGMQPLKKFFTGAETPPRNRMATCQKCIRTGDIENVGVTARHATFFEMLGNFSFGDYFKEESLKMGWEFLTKVLELPEERLWPSVYEEDDEAYALWRDVIGVPESRIVRLGKEDNFWEIGTGPCGPCSEIYFDRGEELGCGSEDCKPGCDCDRFLEVWNHVFTQYDRDENGVYHELEKKNIDTGMGLERIACVLQGVDTIFEVDTIRDIRDAVIALSGVDYGKDRKTDISVRVITDHVKAVVFMIADGIMPNNEGRGYVLRRLLRRASRHAKMLGMTGTPLTELVDAVVASYGENYETLKERMKYIKRVVENEEERFQATIDQGLTILNDYVEDLKKEGKTVLGGESAFKLYDTYGFPIELTDEIVQENGFSVDEASFKILMLEQKERARKARGDDDALGWDADAIAELPPEVRSTFIGYGALKAEATVTALVSDHILDEAYEGMELALILDETPFYAEGGGQIGDTGRIFGDGFEAKVIETRKGVGNRIVHYVQMTKGTVKVGDRATAEVDVKRRMATARNHSATHLLHRALRDALGTHVAQAGSYVTPDRLRFDFSHFEPVDAETLHKIEADVNEAVLAALPIHSEEMSIEAAKEKGAMALFGEKYGDKVRVVEMGDYSMELCGGTHLTNTAQVGLFKIIAESGVAAGVRRIEAVTGESVYKLLTQLDGKVHVLSDMLKASPADVEQKAEALLVSYKQIQRENEALKRELASASMDDIVSKMREVGGYQVITAKFEGTDLATLRDLGDRLKDKWPNAVVVLANAGEGKVEFLAMASEGAVKAGAHAGNLLKTVSKIAGGGGGGRPNMAQAGGKLPEKVDEALQKVYDLLA